MTAPSTIKMPEAVTQQTDVVPRMTHLVDKDRIVDAQVYDFPLMTLCGMMLRPGTPSKEKLPVCEPCKKQLDKIGRILNNN